MIDPDNPMPSVEALEADLGLPAGFFQRLLTVEDDWSFTIKLHALVEAALTHHLRATQQGEVWLTAFPRARVFDKVRFGAAMGILDDREQRFIHKLSEIRNDFVHDVRRAGASLALYAEGLNARKLDELKKAIGPGDSIATASGTVVLEIDFVRQQPKLAMWMSALLYLALAYEGRDLIVLTRQRDEARIQLAAVALRLLRIAPA